ncbi:MAG: DUF177 domain-containing protein [Verrucomicrobia bacterium]|nr:DUF177 domain-containing protein [Verrucomicrobiota bacterium]
MKPLRVNLSQARRRTLKLEGQLPAAALDLESLDEMIKLTGPFDYEFTVEWTGEGLLLSGRLELGIRCVCVRCLNEFEDRVVLEDWQAHAPVLGEEALPVEEDCLDLLPLIREELALALPQHPLCDAGCKGLPEEAAYRGDAEEPNDGLDAWSVLDRLQL